MREKTRITHNFPMKKSISTTILALALAAGASAQTVPPAKQTPPTATAPDPKDQQIASLQQQLQGQAQQIQSLQLHMGQITDSLLNAQAQVTALQGQLQAAQKK
jgi:peptidoglycan hydrolase CwlO-like protein